MDSSDFGCFNHGWHVVNTQKHLLNIHYVVRVADISSHRLSAHSRRKCFLNCLGWLIRAYEIIYYILNNHWGKEIGYSEMALLGALCFSLKPQGRSTHLNLKDGTILQIKWYKFVCHVETTTLGTIAFSKKIFYVWFHLWCYLFNTHLEHNFLL